MAIPIIVKELGIKLGRMAVDATKDWFVKERSNEWAAYLKREEKRVYYLKWRKRQEKAGLPTDNESWQAHVKTKWKEESGEDATGTA